ncbi:MAG TPA: YHS domain-containing (seleno)protein [Beijerinckiaceae bacterium]|jgi:YHS domain-containing protein
MSQGGRTAALAVGLALCGLFPGRALGLPLPPVIGAVETFAEHGASGLALGGFDPVSYHLGRPAPGRAEIEHLWGGVAWRFSSEANRAAFAANPHSYGPRLGGHDALAAARGLLVEADPMLASVRGGGLYLFRTADARAQFEADPDLGRAAEARWPELRRELVHP